MIFIYLIYLTLSFPLKGVWNVSLESYKPKQNQNFRLRFSLQNTTYVGFIRTNEPHKMIPKKIHIKELVPDERYVFILPFSENPRFAEFWFKNETNILTSSVNSTSNEWNVTATILPSERMELLLQKYQKNIWYKYTAIPYPKSSSDIYFYVVIALIVLLIIIIIIKKCFRNKTTTKDKKD